MPKLLVRARSIVILMVDHLPHLCKPGEQDKVFHQGLNIWFIERLVAAHNNSPQSVIVFAHCGYIETTLLDRVSGNRLSTEVFTGYF
jgi:hypothetical protein